MRSTSAIRVMIASRTLGVSSLAGMPMIDRLSTPPRGPVVALPGLFGERVAPDTARARLELSIFMRTYRPYYA